MRTLLHLSDLHFGRIDPATLQPLLATAKEIGPDVVLVSGDLTQRARRRSPTRPGSTLFTATPATIISKKRRCPSPVSAMRRHRAACSQ